MFPPPINDPQRARDEEHLNLLSIFHFVVGGLSLCGILFLLVHYAIFNAVLNNPEFWKNGRNAPPIQPSQIMGFMIFGYLVMGFLMATAGGLNVASGYFLRRRQHRTFCLVIAALNCLQIPFGTILGVFTIIVLSRPSTQSLYPE